MPVRVSHLKLALRSLHGQTDRLLEILDQARADGIEITADILRVKDADGRPRVERILDRAGQKGTGKWTAGPSALGVYLGEKFKGGALIQHYWDYAGDGDGCFTVDVGSWSSPYRDNATLADGAEYDGTYTDGTPFAA